MNLNTSRVCSLPSYPGVDGRGPVALTYLEDQQVLAACGSFEKDDQSCYLLSPDQPLSWQPLAAGDMSSWHCPDPRYTRNHFLKENGWFLVGQSDHCGDDINAAGVSTELLNPQLQWTQPTISSPYRGGYPANTCSVAINSTTVIITGGYNADNILSSTWMLDLTDYSWTQLQDMPGYRYAHGCTTTATGELIIAGGYGLSLSSVFIYNLIDNTWSQASDLPAGWDYYNPLMFLWNKQIIILERYSSNIWILEEASWKKMEATMGATLNGYSDTAITVPTSTFTC